VWTAYRLFVFVCNFLRRAAMTRGSARLDALDLRLTAVAREPADPSRDPNLDELMQHAANAVDKKDKK
jgi:hypothetical protein